MKWENKNEVPVLIVCGQSNAHGHGTHLTDEEKIITPLKNVFGLGRTENQAYGLSHVTWSPFVSFGMNLGETQDHTYCLSTEFARLWQSAINEGDDLPDLYIIQISIGAQGICKDAFDGNNMWYPKREPMIHSGPLGGVNISLYPLAMEILPLAMQSIQNKGFTPKIIGFHWNQWETEAATGGKAIDEAEQNYTELFTGFRKATGQPLPLFLYRPLSDVYNNPHGIDVLTQLFETFATEDPLTDLIDLRQSDYFDASSPTKGIFLSDCVHYTPEVYKWFAAYQWNKLKELL